MKQGPGQGSKKHRVWSKYKSLDNGSILLSALGLMVSLSILISLWLLLSKSILEIVSMQEQADRAYWLAKSEAAVVARELYLNHVTTGYLDSITAPAASGRKGTILVKIEDAVPTDVLQVYVQASEGSSVHTISFQYNQVQKRIVDWTDSDIRLQ